MPPPPSEKPFDHLPLVLTGSGDSRPRKQVVIDPNPITEGNKANRSGHASSLRTSTLAVAERWRESQAERLATGLPSLEPGIPLLLRIDTAVDLDVLRRQFSFEIVSEHDDGFVIVVSKDLDLKLIQQKLDDFEREVFGSGSIAQIHELVDDESQEERLQRILTDQLLREWPTIADDAEYVVDVSIACTGDWQIRNRPKRNPRWKPETWARKENEWSNDRLAAYERWDELKDKRLDDVDTMLAPYNVQVLNNWDNSDTKSVQLPDSFTLRIRTSGKGLRDFVLNYAYVWEVTEPDEIETPQQVARDLADLSAGLTVQVPPTDAPVVCVIDSGIQESHLYLEPAIRDAESRCFLDGASPTDVTDYVKPSGHGTRVAGVVLYGENVPKSGVVELDCWIQNARVLDAHCKMPLTMLPAAVIRDAISHFNRGNTPTRIFNHSINSTVASRTRHMSSWAAEIDQLCHDRDILVLQSVGNIRHSNPVPNPGVAEQLAAEKTYPDYLSEPAARIANPAQSLQALTVGSVAYDTVSAGGWQSLAQQDGEPSAFSRSGHGIWDTIKPEVVEYGGDYMIDGSTPPSVTYPAACASAYPILIGSTLHGQPAVTQDDVGTSYSAPKVARIAARLATVMQTNSCLLYRALIIQSAQWPAWAEPLPMNEQINVLRRLGYGIPDMSRATENTEHRATFTTSNDQVLGTKQCHVFQIPIPPELRTPGGEYDIRIDVTLSYSATPRRTRRSARGYLAVWLDWIASQRGESAGAFLNRALATEDDPDGDRNGELPWTLHPMTQHGLSGVRRNRGTVQKDWAVVKSNALPEDLSIAVRGHQGWSHDPDETATYAIAVTFEIVGQEIPIYDPLRTAVLDLKSIVDVESEAELELDVDS
ncbi:S8 family peptidase [Rhodopirellula bahusiensis]|uniref:Protease n=1 Tax=Rhodopirellula bahusiensis TaxID=2014065 RepID=A0A2G1W0G3_9BACT|nr:S8 family peptidase [Rhodopirellula bahusiensis]PHQ32507.1 protease [Rhodopirellula bahusiensis]